MQQFRFSQPLHRSASVSFSKFESAFWDKFLESKTDIKPKTVRCYHDCRALFHKEFTSDETIEKITSDRLSKWKASLLVEYATASVAGYVKNLQAVLNWAVDQEWLTKNPMKGIPRGNFANRKNDRIITMEEYAKLLEASPDQEWRTIIALARTVRNIRSLNSNFKHWRHKEKSRRKRHWKRTPDTKALPDRYRACLLRPPVAANPFAATPPFNQTALLNLVWVFCSMPQILRVFKPMRQEIYTKINNANQTSPQSASTPVVTPPKKSSLLITTFGCVSLLVVGFIGLVIIGSMSDKKEGGRSTQNQGQQTAITISAIDLTREYEGNEFAADSEYKEKWFFIQGKVAEMGRLPIIDVPYVDLETNDQFRPVRCFFSHKKDTSRLASVRKGQTITFRGTCGGKDITESGHMGVFLYGCTFKEP
jgi:hypothetical protein